MLKRSENYDPVKDRQMKTDELRSLYAKVSNQKQELGREIADQAYDDSDASFISDAVSAYLSKSKNYTSSEERLVQRRPFSEKV